MLRSHCKTLLMLAGLWLLGLYYIYFLVQDVEPFPPLAGLSALFWTLWCSSFIWPPVTLEKSTLEFGPVKYLLKDACYGASRTSLPIVITGDGAVGDGRFLGLAIRPDHTGTMEDPEAAPIYLELYNGQIRLLVWSDITQPNPTHTIYLDTARVLLEGELDES